MTASFLTLEIDTLVIPGVAMNRLRVEYDDLEGRTDRRTADGTFNRRVSWTGKLRATISAEGFAPPGLDGLSSDTLYTVALPKQRDVTSPSNVITLPSGRRSGGLYAPQAFALVDARLVETAVDIVGDTATCTTVAGASGYRVDYYPLISAYLAREPQSLDGDRASHGWRLVAEEA